MFACYDCLDVIYPLFKTTTFPPLFYIRPVSQYTQVAKAGESIFELLSSPLPDGIRAIRYYSNIGPVEPNPNQILHLARTQMSQVQKRTARLGRTKGRILEHCWLDKTRHLICQDVLKSEHLARKTNKSSQSFWNIFNLYKMLSNIIHILDIAPLSGLLI